MSNDAPRRPRPPIRLAQLRSPVSAVLALIGVVLVAVAIARLAGGDWALLAVGALCVWISWVNR